MYNLNKLSFAILSSALLAGCGGGGSGSSDNSGSTNDSSSFVVVSIPATSNSLLSTSGYDTKNLNFSTNIRVSSDGSITGLSKVYHYDNAPTGLLVDNTDKIQIIADGTPVTTSLGWNNISGDYYSYSLPQNTNVYEFTYTRGDEVVGEATLTNLPMPYGVIGSANGEVVNFALTRESNHTYRYVAESLYCKKSTDSFHTNLKSNNYLKDNEGQLSSDYSRSIVDAFGYSLTSLQTTYETCKVEVDFSARLNNMNLDKSSANIDIYASSSNQATVMLF